MKKRIATLLLPLLLLTMALPGCVVVRDHCPPGQAKKGNC